MRFSALLSICVAAAACNSSDATDDPTTGHLTGTLYYDTGAELTIDKIDLATGKHTLLGKGKRPQKTPQGTLLCTVDSNLAEAPETLETYRHIDDESLDSSSLFAEGFDFPRLSPDGSKIAYVTNEGKIGVVDRQSGAILTTLVDPTIGLGYSRPSWTPDGRLVFGSQLGSEGIFITDAALANPKRIDPMLTETVDAIVSHNGQFVAFTSSKQVWRMGIDGSNPIKVDADNTDDPNDELPFWSPDDSVIFWHFGYSDVGFRAADGTKTTVLLSQLYPDTVKEIEGISQGTGMDWVP